MAVRGGETLGAPFVRHLTKRKDFLFADRGEISLRGFEDPVRLFEVRTWARRSCAASRTLSGYTR